jgi:hypothetical protein
VTVLLNKDPLSERVHLGKGAVASIGILGLLSGTAGRFSRVFTAPQTRNA